MKRYFLFLLTAFLFAACSGGQQYAAVPAGATVLILGDSLTYGTGAEQGQDYPSILAANSGWNIINAGVPGDTSADGLDRLPELLDQHKASLLIVALGGNDFLRRLPEKETAGNLSSVLAEARNRGIQAILLAIPQFSPIGAAVGSLSDHPLYEKLANEARVPLVENVFSGVLAKNALKADPIHPNAEGYRIVEDNLRTGLKEKGFLNQESPAQ